MVNRIETLRKRMGLTMADLAEAVGTDASTINKLEKGKTRLTSDWLTRLARALEVSIEEILVDKNDGFIKYKGMAAFEGMETRDPIRSFDPDDEEHVAGEGAGYTLDTWRPSVPGGVPEIDMKLGAGSGILSGELLNVPLGDGAISAHPIIAEWVFPETFLRNDLKVGARSIIIEEIVGDSMTPTYMPGDKVIVDLSQNTLASDTVYAISDGQSEPQIKRLQRVPFSNPAQVIIISDNPNLERFTVPLADVRIIGRVAGVVSRR